jgi:hypothetical protein
MGYVSLLLLPERPGGVQGSLCLLGELVLGVMLSANFWTLVGWLFSGLTRPQNIGDAFRTEMPACLNLTPPTVGSVPHILQLTLLPAFVTSLGDLDRHHLSLGWVVVLRPHS